MTCDEYRSYIAEGKTSDGIDHVEHCDVCRAFVSAHEEVSRQLRMVRDAVPEVSPMLDEAVMTAYRIEREQKARVPVVRKKIALRLSWAALAAGVILAAALLMANRKAPSPPASTISQAMPAPAAEGTESPGKRTEPRVVATTKKHVHTRPSGHRPESSTSVATNASQEPDFQNLMYCDPLSCSGAMQLIRIQVPASAVDEVPAMPSRNGMVQADVVVGPDGVARAIRIVR